MAHSIEASRSTTIDIHEPIPHDHEDHAVVHARDGGVLNEGWFRVLGGAQATTSIVASMLARYWLASDQGHSHLIEHRSTLDMLKSMLPTMLWTSVVAGAKHYQGSGALAPVAGQLPKLLASPCFYDFVRDLRTFGDGESGPNHEAITFFIMNKPCILVQDNADVVSVFKTDKVTQATKPGEGISPLIAFQDLFGLRSPILQDPWENGTKNELYGKLRSMFTKHTMQIPKLEQFAASEMVTVIEQHLEAAATGSEPMELTSLLTGMVMDIPGAMLAGYRNPTPSSFYHRSEENRELLEDVLKNLSDASYFVFSGARARAVAETKRRMMEFAKEMISGNFDAIRQPDGANMIRDIWKLNLGETPFPASFAEFTQLLEHGDNGQREAVEMVLLGAAFLQLASTETSAQALNFAIRELLNRPQSLREIRKELSAASFDPTKFTLPALSKNQPRLCAFILETLRRYPPVPVPPYVATESYPARVGGRDVIIEKGTWVWKDIERANQSGRFKEDGSTFRPERWLEGDGSFDAATFLRDLSSDRANFHTFSGGLSDKPNPSAHSRVCPGRLLAFTEIAMAMAILVTKYDFEAVEDSVSLEYTAGSTLEPTTDLHLRLTPRSSRTSESVEGDEGWNRIGPIATQHGADGASGMTGGT